MSPLCESYVPAERLGAMEPFYPLHVRVCERCLLVQLEEFVAPEEIFTEYAYFSSYSDSWVAHARDYVDSAVERFGLDADSLVVELASNDGYLLQHVVERGIPALGVEPAANVAGRRASAASRRSSRSSVASSRRASWRRAGGQTCSSPTTCWHTFPTSTTSSPACSGCWRQRAWSRSSSRTWRGSSTGNQFDTIYHEHFSYFSFLTAQTVLRGPRARGVRRRRARRRTAARCASMRSVRSGDRQPVSR